MESEKVITNEDTIKWAAYYYVHSKNVYQWVDMQDDEPNDDADEIWWQTQLDAKKSIGEMLVDDVEEKIHSYDQLLQCGKDLVAPGTSVADAYKQIARMWAEIKIYIRTDIPYPDDADDYEYEARKILYDQIEEAGGEEKYFDQFHKE